MKKNFVIASFLLCTASIHIKAQNTTVDGIISRVISDFHHADAADLQKLIHPEDGLIVLYRPGAMDAFQRVDSINFEKPFPSYYPYFQPEYDGEGILDIRGEKVPVFDCDIQAWPREGVFVDQESDIHLLSTIARSLNEYEDANIPEETIAHYEELENQSYRVVLADNEKGDLVFYVRWDGSEWSLWILDRLSTDCSA